MIEFRTADTQHYTESGVRLQATIFWNNLHGKWDFPVNVWNYVPNDIFVYGIAFRGGDFCVAEVAFVLPKVTFTSYYN